MGTTNMIQRRLCGALTIAAALALAAPALAAAPAILKAAPRGEGPYPAVMATEKALPEHTLYRPASLPAGQRLPLVVFAEGGCRNIGNRSFQFMSNLASYGYLVLVAGPPSPWTTRERDGNEKPAPGADVLSQPHQLVEAVDWAARENARPASPYYRKLDLAKVASMGFSCGGVQALDFTVADKRVTNTVMIYSGLFPDDKPAGAVKYAGVQIVRADLPRVIHPILYVYGGDKDIANPNAENDIAHIDKAPLFAASQKAAGHGDGLEQLNGGRQGELAVSWLNWWFKGDAAAGRIFTAPDCPLCNDPAWVVKRKNLPR